MTFRSSHWSEQQAPAITEARRALKLRKGPPAEDDRPRIGKRIALIPGQLSLDGYEHQ
jgi:hypothetical protein